MKEDTKKIQLQPDDGTYCEPSVHDLEVSEGEICPKGFGAIATMSVKSSCCEPNNGAFFINGEDMDGMPGVSYPDEGGNGDWGDGPERKSVVIDCDNFQYDIKDGDWNIRWTGLCDQRPGFFTHETTFVQKTDCSSGGGGEPEPEPPPPPTPPPTVDPMPPSANDGRGNCEPGNSVDPDMTCKTGTILTTGYTNPTFFTHAYDPAMVRSVDVINPYDPDKRFMRIVFDPHVCDVDEIIETLCSCTSEDAFGNPIIEFGEVTATKVDDYTVDVVIRGSIIETNGNEP